MLGVFTECYFGLIQASGKGFTDFSGLRSSSAFLPFRKKTSDDFVSAVSLQTAAVSSVTLFSHL